VGHLGRLLALPIKFFTKLERLFRVKADVFLPDKSLQPSIMFDGKGRVNGSIVLGSKGLSELNKPESLSLSSLSCLVYCLSVRTKPT
jgi:hypothetical protein